MANKDKKSLHVKTSDRVVVIAGKDKGKIGNIQRVDREKGRVFVEGANMVNLKNLSRLPEFKADLLKWKHL